MAGATPTFCPYGTPGAGLRMERRYRGWDCARQTPRMEPFASVGLRSENDSVSSMAGGDASVQRMSITAEVARGLTVIAIRGWAGGTPGLTRNSRSKARPRVGGMQRDRMGKIGPAAGRGSGPLQSQIIDHTHAVITALLPLVQMVVNDGDYGG